MVAFDQKRVSKNPISLIIYFDGNIRPALYLPFEHKRLTLGPSHGGLILIGESGFIEVK